MDDWAAAYLAGDDAAMIASHRADVRDLNDRARALMDAADVLGDPERGIDKRIQIDGREFAVGDRVLSTGRNHYDLDILNGDLDRQAAYSALSRGRIENRLYMLEPDEDLQGLIGADALEAQRPPGPELTLEHLERELSRDRSQHRATEHLDPLAVELLASLPEPDGQPIGHSTPGLLEQISESVGPPRSRSLTDDLLADLPDPNSDQLADEVAAARARLDRLQQRESHAVDDDFSIEL